MPNKRWQDWATLVAGLWFAVAPWVLGHGDASTVVLYNALAVGVALVFFSAGALARPQTLEEVVDFLIGAWIVALPWVLGYDTMRDLTVNAVVVGLIVASVAGVAGWMALERVITSTAGTSRGPLIRRGSMNDAPAGGASWDECFAQRT